MNFQRQVCRLLDDEHRANLEILGRVEDAFARVARGSEADDPELAQIVGAFARHVERDIDRHFEFEERELFPRMDEHGDGDLASLLRDEHDAIRAVGVELLPLARAAVAGSLDRAGWAELRRSAREMIEREMSHIQKETMALLPLVDDLLDEDTDRELAFGYAATA
ncbi:MAG TPA: hemerythrin domain-containing protein [Casimicrobiaceae bacterium]